jgi:hypothetical protein
METVVLTESIGAGAFIASEANGKRSRDNVTVTLVAGATLKAGTVLGRLTATGKYVPYDNAGGDGSDVAYGILYAELVNSDDDNPKDLEGVVLNQDCEVAEGDLVWADGLVDADKAAAKVDLAARGIKVRPAQ